MASKSLLLLGLLFAIVILISSNVVSAGVSPAATETKVVEPEGWHHHEEHHHHCYHNHCDDKDKYDGGATETDSKPAEDGGHKKCKHWPHC